MLVCKADKGKWPLPVCSWKEFCTTMVQMRTVKPKISNTIKMKRNATNAAEIMQIVGFSPAVEHP